MEQPSRVHFQSYEFKDIKLIVKFAVPCNWSSKILSKDIFLLKEEVGRNPKFRSNAIFKLSKINKLSIKRIANLVKLSVKKQYYSSELISEYFGSELGDSIAVVDYMIYTNNAHLGSSTLIRMHKEKVFLLNYIALNEPAGLYAQNRLVFTGIVNTFGVTEL